MSSKEKQLCCSHNLTRTLHLHIFLVSLFSFTPSQLSRIDDQYFKYLSANNHRRLTFNFSTEQCRIENVETSNSGYPLVFSPIKMVFEKDEKAHSCRNYCNREKAVEWKDGLGGLIKRSMTSFERNRGSRRKEVTTGRLRKSQ